MSIDKHEWFDMTAKIKRVTDIAVCLDTKDIPWVGIGMCDVIALAKHFNLTAEDINCTKLKDKQSEIDTADEMAFDECAELRAEISRLNNIIKSKRVN